MDRDTEPKGGAKQDDLQLPGRGAAGTGAAARERLISRVVPGGLARREPEAVAGDGGSAGAYALVRRLGEGGMGAVWEARHSESGRPVALKLLRPVAAAHEPTRKRFLREARTAALVKHDHIVDITDVGTTAAGVPFIVMELLGGRTLEHVLRDVGALPWPRARKILLQVADALEFAHTRGVVHRDLKPANVMMLGEGESDRCKLIDFGLARRQIVSSTSEAVSRTGEVFGSPPYMSPEQFRGEAADARTDIYGFGCLMFHVLTGQRPFSGQGIGELMYQHLFEPAPTPTGMDCPGRLVPALESIVLRAMRKATEGRFADMAELTAALRRLDQDPRPVEVPADEGLPTRATSALGGRVAWLIAMGVVAAAAGASAAISLIGPADAPAERNVPGTPLPGDAAGRVAPETPSPGGPAGEVPGAAEAVGSEARSATGEAGPTPEAPAAADGVGEKARGATGDEAREPGEPPARSEGTAGKRRKRRRRSDPEPRQPPKPAPDEPRTSELPPNPFRSGSRTPGQNKP